jgi:MraZ protein
VVNCPIVINMKLIGRYYHALEQKGRVSIPPSIRCELGETAILTRGLDGCLFLFSIQDWGKTVSETLDLPLTQKVARDWVRLMANNATEVNFDNLNRILIPQYLREAAKLTKDVVLVGSLNRVEIWDQKTYHLYLETLEASAEAIAEKVYANTHTSNGQ